MSLTFSIDESRGVFATAKGDINDDGECGIESVCGLVEDKDTVADGNEEVNSMSDCNFLFVSSWNRPFVADFFT